MPGDAATPVSGCALCGAAQTMCGGLGYIQYNVPYGHPNFGKMLRCPRQLQAEQTRITEMRDIANLSAYADKTLDNFVTEREGLPAKHKNTLASAVERARTYAAKPEGWLLITGFNGTGKTHLAAGVANVVVAKHHALMFVTAPDLFDHLRRTYQEDSDEGYDEVFERVRNIPFLVLDDLGVENQSTWVTEKLFQLLNHRYIHRLPTIITSNIIPEHFPPRLSSRMLDQSVVHHLSLDVADYRTGRHQQWMYQITDLTRYTRMTFDNFDPALYTKAEEREILKRALDATWSFAHEPAMWMFLQGEAGVGKTHLAAAAAKVIQASGLMVCMLSASDLLDRLRASFSSSSIISFDVLFRFICEIDVLFLEDVGTDNSTPWAREKLFQILDYRYVARKATFMTSSKKLTHLDDPRLYVRLLDEETTTWIEIPVTPYSLRMREAKGHLPSRW